MIRVVIADDMAASRTLLEGIFHMEPGFGPETTGALESAGFEVRAWPTSHHYFGGVSAVTPTGGAGDPRRSGAARVV